MGTRAFDYLIESPFFDDQHIEQGFASFSESDLRAELARYREFILQHKADLLEETRSESSLKIFAGTNERVDGALLKQGALYLDQFIIDDPLFAQTAPETQGTIAMNAYLGMPPAQLSREAVASAARALKQLTPMVAANYIKILPISHLFEAPEQIPIYASEDNFETVLEPQFMTFFKNRATVLPLRYENGALVEDPSLVVSRAIAVRIGDEPAEMIRLFQLFENDPPGEYGTSEWRMFLPSSPPPQDHYEHWVRQSINRSAAMIFADTARALSLSSALHAGLMTASSSTFELVQLMVPTGEPMPAAGILNVTLPFLDGITPEALMRARQEELGAFEGFRRSLARKLRDAAGLTPEQRTAALQTFAQELHDQAEDLGPVVTRARKKFATNAIVTLAGLSAAVPSSGITLPLAITGAAHMYSAYLEYRSALQAPPYFLWKAIDASRT